MPELGIHHGKQHKQTNKQMSMATHKWSVRIDGTRYDGEAKLPPKCKNPMELVLRMAIRKIRLFTDFPTEQIERAAFKFSKKSNATKPKV